MVANFPGNIGCGCVLSEWAYCERYYHRHKFDSKYCPGGNWEGGKLICGWPNAAHSGLWLCDNCAVKLGVIW